MIIRRYTQSQKIWVKVEIARIHFQTWGENGKKQETTSWEGFPIFCEGGFAWGWCQPTQIKSRQRCGKWKTCGNFEKTIPGLGFHYT